HVVDAAGVRRVEELLLHLGAVLAPDDHVQVALGDLHPGRAVAVDAHRAEVDGVHVETGLDHGRQQVVRGVDVVVDRVALVPARLHRVGRRALLGEVHDGVGLLGPDQVEEPGVVAGDVDAVEPHRPARDLLPRPQAHAHRLDRREAAGLELVVDVATREVVEDHDLVTELAQVQAGGPAAEAVTTEYEDLHQSLQARVGAPLWRAAGTGPQRTPRSGRTDRARSRRRQRRLTMLRP